MNEGVSEGVREEGMGKRRGGREREREKRGRSE